MGVSAQPESVTWQATVGESREDGDQLSASVVLTDGANKYQVWLPYDGTADSLAARVVAWISMPRDAITAKRTRVAVGTPLSLVFPDPPAPPVALPPAFLAWRASWSSYRLLAQQLANDIPSVTSARVDAARVDHRKLWNDAFEVYL